MSFLEYSCLKRRATMLYRIGLIVCMLMMAPPGWAQPKAFKPEVRKIIPLSAVVDEAPGRAYAVGSELEMRSRSLPSAMALRNSGLQARIFNVSRNGVEPDSLLTLADCYIYISSVIAIPAGGGTTVSLGRLDHAWLAGTAGVPAQTGRFLLVFEQAGHDDSLFRLSNRSAANNTAFFKAGFYFEVTKPPISYSQKEFDDAVARRAAVGVQIEKDKYDMLNSKKNPYPCYQYHAGLEDDPQHLALLETCRMDGDDSAF